MKKITLAVLFGGSSTEYEISLQSAHAVLTHLDRDRYEPVLLGITRDGRWLLYQGPVDALLQYYSAAAQRQEIRADLALTIPAGVPLGDVEWCTVLGNLLENALEACQRQSRGERRLSLTSWATEGTLFLLVENTYDGRFVRSEGHILSRKAGGVRCGIGLSSVRETVERRGGTLDLYPGEDVFQVGITLPIHNR